MKTPGQQVDGTLAVRETEGAYLVVRSEDPEDWLARFEKGPRFPAREWAENMVSVFNRRLSLRRAGPPTPPGTRLESHHPREEVRASRGPGLPDPPSPEGGQ
jgi:hypothetical protein